MAHLSALVGDDDPAGLVLPLGVVEVGVEGGADDDIVQLVSVQVGHAHRVAEVGADLLPRQVEQVLQLAVVQHHLRQQLGKDLESLQTVLSKGVEDTKT